MVYIDAYVALGSNLDEPSKQLDLAVALIAKLPRSKIIALSSKYITKPYGYLNQDNFVNAVLHLSTNLSAVNLLNYLLKIEEQMGRVRSVKWGPRIIDLDLLLHAESVTTTPNLTIPHPEMHKRDFVLEPLCELNPNLIIPGFKQNIAELLQSLHVISN